MKTKMVNLVRELFDGKFDKGGKPYIGHLYRVADPFLSSFDSDLYDAAIGHDILEDIPNWNAEMLKDYTSEKSIELIKILTHSKNETYDDYIERISENTNAIKIKLSDLKDNMDYTRLKNIDEKDIIRLKKYHRSYMFLKEKLAQNTQMSI